MQPNETGENDSSARDNQKENPGCQPRLPGVFTGRFHAVARYCHGLAGGGIRGGWVYGESNRSGAAPTEDGCTPADLHATIFEALGLPHTATITDRLGRPFPISDRGPLPLT